MSRPPGRLRRRVAWNLSAQALWSASNFVLVLLALVSVPARPFAVFSVAITTYYLAAQLARAVVGIPVLLAGPGPEESPPDGDPSAAMSASVLLGVAVAVPVAGIGLLWREGLGPFLVLAAGLAPLLLQDALRHLAIARYRPDVATQGDGVRLASELVLAGAVLAAGWESATALMGVWVVSAAVSAGWLVVRLDVRPRLERSVAWYRANLVLCRRLAVEFVMTASGFYVLSYALALLAGAEEVGYLRAAQTLFGPASVLLLGGAVLGVPEGVRARHEPTQLLRFAARLSVMLAALSVACGVAVYAVLPSVGPRLFADIWEPVRDVMPALTVYGAALGFAAGPIACLRAVDDMRWIVTARMASTVVALVIGLPAAAAYGAQGTLAALALSEWVLAVRAWIRLRARPR
ncbi:MAG TPA: hypothetical protein VF045_11670 [Acidimicrobiales bacterium]